MLFVHCFIKVQEARQNHDDDTVKKAVNEYDEALERYMYIINHRFCLFLHCFRWLLFGPSHSVVVLVFGNIFVKIVFFYSWSYIVLLSTSVQKHERIFLRCTLAKNL